MRAVVQRVKETSLEVDGKLISKIPFGLTVFLGIKTGDTEKEASYLMKKISALRIFEDENGKMNFSVSDTRKEILIVSNFTLCASCRRGTRPDFFGAAKPDEANRLYEYFIKKASESGLNVQSGEFGADMKIDASLDGPVTIILDSEKDFAKG